MLPALFFYFAVRGGFEPPIRLPVRQFSKLMVSATHPPHRKECKVMQFCRFRKIFQQVQKKGYLCRPVKG